MFLLILLRHIANDVMELFCNKTLQENHFIKAEAGNHLQDCRIRVDDGIISDCKQDEDVAGLVIPCGEELVRHISVSRRPWLA